MRVEVETETPQKCLASAFENGDFFAILSISVKR